jgi:hypothetical protein
MRPTVPLLLLLAGISALAQGRGQSGRRFTGPCASADPALGRIANATGGQQYLLRSGEMEKTGAVMEAKLLHSADVFFASGVLRRGAYQDFQVPVDSTVESAAFSVTVQCKESVAIWRPSGDAVMPGGVAGFTDTDLAGGRVLTVKRPETGVWRIRISGAGQFSVSVRAKSDLDLTSFDFVRAGGRPGHEGLFPIEGQPTSPDQTARARLSGPFRSAAFRLISEAGDALQPLALSTAGDREEFYGSVRLPAQAFRVLVEGQDERGYAYQRVLARTFQLQTIAIAALTPVQELKAGTTTRLSFQVHNLGPAGTLEVTMAWVGRDFVKTPPATRIPLPAGGAAVVETDVDIPADAVPGTEVTISVAASRRTPPAGENGIAISATVR